MTAIYRKITDLEKDEKFIDEAATALVQGRLVAIPTETVYGIGANALDEDAIKAIFLAKGRPSDNPLIVHIAKVSDLEKYVQFVPLIAKKLAKAFWPGPLTMIFTKKMIIPDVVTCGMKTVAIRIPNHPITLEIINRADVPIAAPSANLSGRPSPTTADHVLVDLASSVDLIIDGGPCDIGLESTVLDLTRGIPIILRYGMITQQMIEEIVGPIMIDQSLISKSEVNTPLAPGMKYKHYAPKAELYIIQGKEDEVIDKINHLIEMNAPKKIGVLCCNENQIHYNSKFVINLGPRNKPEVMAQHLFSALRRFDDLKVDVIYSEAYLEEEIGVALMNRLYKAAGNKVIKL